MTHDEFMHKIALCGVHYRILAKQAGVSARSVERWKVEPETWERNKEKAPIRALVSAINDAWAKRKKGG